MCSALAIFATAPSAETFEEDLAVVPAEALPCREDHTTRNPHRARRDGVTYLWYGDTHLYVTLDPEGVVGGS